MLRAIGTPVIVGVVLFAGAVATAVVLGLVQPHTPETAAAFGEPDGSGPPAADGAADAAGDRAETVTVLVHVVGKVKSPGVVELSAGARVRDAIAAAGGATDRAALASVNLARAVVDGEQIAVSRPPAAGAAAGAAGSGSVGTTAPDPVMIGLNSSDAAALEELPNVGPALAQRIIEWRQAHGAFSDVEQLLEVPGIGPKTLAGFRDRVRV